MSKELIYIHGKDGSAKEAEHYVSLFPDYQVIGLNYRSRTPWEAAKEFSEFFNAAHGRHDEIVIAANSIGAYLAMNSLAGKPISKAYFISPIVDMEKLITDMMYWADVSEDELREQGEIATEFGETLSWEYLKWAREHPIKWEIPTSILYGDRDHLQSIETIEEFAGSVGADLTVMEGGEHWFHTPEEMNFLDQWIEGVRYL